MMGQGRCRRLSMAFLIALPAMVLGAVPARAAGEVTGHVQDAQGQPLPGVSVKLIKAGKEASQQQTSDSQGNFRFADLVSGVYAAAATLEGYAAVDCPGVRMIAGILRRLEIKLMPAGGEQPSSCVVVAE